VSERKVWTVIGLLYALLSVVIIMGANEVSEQVFAGIIAACP